MNKCVDYAIVFKDVLKEFIHTYSKLLTKYVTISFNFMIDFKLIKYCFVSILNKSYEISIDKLSFLFIRH